MDDSKEHHENTRTKTRLMDICNLRTMGEKKKLSFGVANHTSIKEESFQVQKSN